MNLYKNKIIVIGATGETGTYLVDQLIEGKHDVFAVGYKNVNKEYYKQKKIGCASVDIRIKKDFEQLPIDNVHSVVLLSGFMPARMKGYDPQKYIDVHVTGTLNTLEYCKKAKAEKIIFAQSHSDVAGFWNTGRYIKDDEQDINLIGDHAVYIISKTAGVNLVRHYNKEFGIKDIIFRLPTIYCHGPYHDMYINGKPGLVPYRLLIKKAMNNEPIEIWGDPNIAKDIVYVKDFVQMIIKSITSARAKGMYNVGSGLTTTLDEQVKGIVKVFSDPENPSKISYQPQKKSQTSYLYDITKAKRDLDYIVKYPYMKMLEDIKIEMNSNRFDHIAQ